MSAPVLMNREAREKGFELKRHFVGEDEREYTKAIPGYTGHLRNAKDIFGVPAGKLLETDAAGGIATHVSQPQRASSGSTFISALPSDGAVWDHKYETTSHAMNKPTERILAATRSMQSPTSSGYGSGQSASPKKNVVGYTGHLHMAQSVIGESHDKVAALSDAATEECRAVRRAAHAEAERNPDIDESRPHWTKFATEKERGRTWKQDYTQTLTTRPNPRKQTDANSGRNGSGDVEIDADIAAQCPPRKVEDDDQFLDMGPRPLFLYDNTLMTDAPEDERGYTGHFSAAKVPKRIVGYTGYLHGAQDTLGLNFGRVERRVNPYEKPPEEKHPLGARYTNAAPPIPQLPPAVKALVQRPSRPRRSGHPVIDQLRIKIMQRGGRHGFRGLARVLHSMDDDGNRQLNKYELQNGLNGFGIHPTPQEVQELMDHFDTDKSGLISVTEFVRGLRGGINERRLALVNHAYNEVRRNSEGQEVTFGSLQTLFDPAQHPEVLAGEKTPHDALVEFGKHWEKTKDAHVSLEEFIDYYSDVSAGVDNDQYFELLLRNVWHLHGGDGPSASTSARRVLVVHNDGSEEVVVLQNDLGVTPTDMHKIRERLQQQGVTRVKSFTVL